MKLKTALVILAQFVEKTTRESDGGRFNDWVDDIELCAAAGVDPDQLKEALTVAGRALLG